MCKVCAFICKISWNAEDGILQRIHIRESIKFTIQNEHLNDELFGFKWLYQTFGMIITIWEWFHYIWIINETLNS